MAETEIKRIIDIEFKGAQTIGDIKKQISQLKKELDECAAGSKQAADKSLELANAQNTLSAAMKGCVTEVGKLDNSYNGLVTRMNRLKIAQKQVDLTTKEGVKQFQDYAKQIKGINNQLLKLDTSNGNFSRNVGNYTSALSSMGGQFGRVASGINTVRTSLQALKAGAGWIGLIAGVLTGIVMAIKSNEDAVDRLKIAVAPFVGIFNQLITLAQKLGDIVSKGIAQLLNGVTSLTEGFLELIGAEETLKKMRDADEISRKENELEEDRVRLLEKQNERLSEMNELRNRYQKWRKDDQIAAYTAYQIEELRKKDAYDTYKLRKEEYELIKLKNEQTKSGRKDIEAELEAQQKMIQAETELYTSGEEWVRVLRNGNVEASKMMLNFGVAAAQTRLEALEATKSEKQRMADNARTETERMFYLGQIQEIETEINLIVKERSNLLADLTEVEKKEAEELEERRKKEAEESEKRRNQYIDEIKKRSEVLNDYILSYLEGYKAFDRLENLTEKQLKEINDMLNDSDKWANILIEDAYRLGRTISKELLPETTLQRLVRLRGDFKKGLQISLDNGDITPEQFQMELEHFGKDFAIKVPVIVEEPSEEDDTDSLEIADKVRKRVAATVDAYKEQTKNIHQQYEQQKKDLEIALHTKLITQEQFNIAMKNLDKEYLDAKRAIMFEEINIYAEMADSIGSILGSIADMWEDDLRTKVEHGEMTKEEAEKEFEQVKAFQIAEAVISTISGAITAYAGAAGNSGINAIPLVGPALAQTLGIINAAAVTASGVAQIAKIKNTQLGSSSVGGGNGTSNQTFQLPSLESYRPNYSQNLTSASDTSDLAQSVATAIGQTPITAVVVESQLRGVQDRVNKRNQEITF